MRFAPVENPAENKQETAENREEKSQTVSNESCSGLGMALSTASVETVPVFGLMSHTIPGDLAHMERFVADSLESVQHNGPQAISERVTLYFMIVELAATLQVANQLTDAALSLLMNPGADTMLIKHKSKPMEPFAAAFIHQAARQNRYPLSASVCSF